jgi:hypothetical protein
MMIASPLADDDGHGQPRYVGRSLFWPPLPLLQQLLLPMELLLLILLCGRQRPSHRRRPYQ